MRTFIWVILAVLAIVLFFILAGYLSPGQENREQIAISAPVEFVWTQYMDKDLMPKWMPGIQEITLIDGSEGQAGAVYNIALNSINDNSTVMKQSITKVNQFKEYAFDFDSDFLIGSTLIGFEAESDSTSLLTIENKYKGKAFWTNSLLQIFRPKIDKDSKEQNNALKTIIEEQYQKGEKGDPNKQFQLNHHSPQLDSNAINQG